MIPQKTRSYGFQRALLLTTAALCFALPVATAGPQDEAAGASDHGAISRYKGSVLLFYDRQDYDSYLLPLGSWASAKRDFQSSRTVEGEVTRRSYVAPEGISVLTAYRNFESAVKSSGLKILYACAERNCSRGFALNYIRMMPERLRPKDHYHNFHALPQMTYFAAEGEHKGRPIWVSVGIGMIVPAASRYRDASDRIRRFGTDRVVFFIDTIEGAAMATGMVAINLDRLTQGIAKDGKVVLDGIFFDTDQAVVKPESDKTLALIADYMKSNSAMKFFVTGHTDSAGSYEHNLKLSDARAKAVAAALSGKHGIAASRLQAVGVGPVAPVATNDTDEGRAKNRRVELVKR